MPSIQANTLSLLLGQVYMSGETTAFLTSRPAVQHRAPLQIAANEAGEAANVDEDASGRILIEDLGKIAPDDAHAVIG